MGKHLFHWKRCCRRKYVVTFREWCCLATSPEAHWDMSCNFTRYHMAKGLVQTRCPTFPTSWTCPWYDQFFQLETQRKKFACRISFIECLEKKRHKIRHSPSRERFPILRWSCNFQWIWRWFMDRLRWSATCWYPWSQKNLAIFIHDGWSPWISMLPGYQRLRAPALYNETRSADSDAVDGSSARCTRLLDESSCSTRTKEDHDGMSESRYVI